MINTEEFLRWLDEPTIYYCPHCEKDTTTNPIIIATFDDRGYMATNRLKCNKCEYITDDKDFPRSKLSYEQYQIQEKLNDSTDVQTISGLTQI